MTKTSRLNVLSGQEVLTSGRGHWIVTHSSPQL